MSNLLARNTKSRQIISEYFGGIFHNADVELHAKENKGPIRRDCLGWGPAMITLPPFWQLVVLLATHWVGDFVLQTNFQASNKNKRLDALSLHVATYTATLFLAAIILFGVMVAVIFAVVNGALHFVTDYITSRVSSKLWAEQNWHRFFVTIGFDQLIHQATLASTLWIIAI